MLRILLEPGALHLLVGFELDRAREVAFFNAPVKFVAFLRRVFVAHLEIAFEHPHRQHALILLVSYFFGSQVAADTACLVIDEVILMEVDRLSLVGHLRLGLGLIHLFFAPSIDRLKLSAVLVDVVRTFLELLNDEQAFL